MQWEHSYGQININIFISSLPLLHLDIYIIKVRRFSTPRWVTKNTIYIYIYMSIRANNIYIDILVLYHIYYGLYMYLHRTSDYVLVHICIRTPYIATWIALDVCVYYCVLVNLIPFYIY